MRRKGLNLRGFNRLPPGELCSSKWARGQPKRLARCPRARGRVAVVAIAAGCSHLRARRGESGVACARIRASSMVFVPGEPNRWEGWEDACPSRASRRFICAPSLGSWPSTSQQPLLRPLRAGLRPCARLPQRRGHSCLPRVHRARCGRRDLVWRFAFWRARRRAGACRAVAENVRARNSSTPLANSKRSGIRTTAESRQAL